MLRATQKSRTVAVIGGGVSGALTAFHLRRSAKELRIVIVDPRPEFGLGLAYSTPGLRHLLNVPAGKIVLAQRISPRALYDIAAPPQGGA